MSRIGKQPISIPDKVNISLNGKTVVVKGPKGELSMSVAEGVSLEKVENTILVKPENDQTKTRALWGLTRTLVNNMVVGVSEGFTKDLEFNGVGYRAAVQGDKITLSLGYSHPIEYQLPKGISVAVNKNLISVSGSDKELVGFTAAKIRSFRSPEPYKGKGIKYVNEVIIRKAGKTGGKK